MNIKSLLIGSAAALMAVSGAQAADAIVAAEPEPLEYVRVCDAFGTGFFYIPGTETCLKIGGFVRFQTSFGRDIGGDANDIDSNAANHSDWDSFTKLAVTFDARNDTELGTLRSFIALEANADSDNGGDGDFDIDEAFIELAGFKVGFFYSWWDSGINGETDVNGNVTEFNSIAYNYDGGTWRAGISLDEIEDAEYVKTSAFQPAGAFRHNNLGVAGTVGFSLGGVNLDILGGYDNAVGEGAIRAILSADLGPGTLQVLGVWASDPNAYWEASEWSVAASYAFKATEKFTITPGVQYFGDINTRAAATAGGKVKGLANYGFSNLDRWKVGVTLDYAIVDGLNFKGTVNYVSTDRAGGGHDDSTSGFLRLQRNF